MRVERTTVDLRNELFEMLARLRAGEITHHEAIAGAKIAAQINEGLKIDMQCAHIVCGQNWAMEDSVYIPSIKIT